MLSAQARRRATGVLRATTFVWEGKTTGHAARDLKDWAVERVVLRLACARRLRRLRAAPRL